MKMGKTIVGLLSAVALVVALFWLLPEPEAPEPPGWPEQPSNSFVLRDVRLFDGETVRDRVDVLVRDGMIAAVGPKVPVPDGAPEYAATGHTLLPAFIDAHTHNFQDSRTEALRFGVGTQIDMFTSVELLPAARGRESLERVSEADMWSAGTLVTAAGGHGTQFGVPIPTLDAAGEADAFVADRIAEGSDFIKLVLEHGWTSTISTLDDATLAAVIAAAQARDRLAVVHVSRLRDAEAALAAGADALVHLFGDAVADEALVALAREGGAFVVPTLSVLESMAGRSNGLAVDARIAPYLAPHMAETLERGFPGREGREAILANALASTLALFTAGVPILAGSDAPNPGTAHGASLHRELELLVEAGLPPAAALAAATSVPADRFQLADRGRIAVESRADLLLVEGDPLADITASRAIVAVWKNGYRITRQRLDGSDTTDAEALADGRLGLFEDGADGWIPTTDGIQGGSSEVELGVAKGALVVEARVASGAPWPWAGAIRMLASEPMAPRDISAFDTLALRMRGDGHVQVLFFSGVSEQGMPQSWTVQLDGGWTEVRIPLADVQGLDRSRTRAIAVVAGPAPGGARFEIDSVALLSRTGH